MLALLWLKSRDSAEPGLPWTGAWLLPNEPKPPRGAALGSLAAGGAGVGATWSGVRGENEPNLPGLFGVLLGGLLLCEEKPLLYEDDVPE